jgi:hypothetical protein
MECNAMEWNNEIMEYNGMESWNHGIMECNAMEWNNEIME